MFNNRSSAGKELAEALFQYEDREDTIVLALPRGGVPVAFEVAQRLHLPLDVLVTRKIGVPGHKELAMGAISAGGVRVMNDDVVRMAGVSESQIQEAVDVERRRAEKQEETFRGDKEALSAEGKHVILVDDGLATGASMRAALKAVQAQEPAETIVAVPVGSPDSVRAFEKLADKVVALETPSGFQAVGQFYSVFDQTTDEEVRRLLKKSNA
ncbi:MAG: phosphoribosyltransferase [Spirochaetaceae bacterium]